MSAAAVEVLADWDLQVAAGAVPALTIAGYRDCVQALVAFALRVGLYEVKDITANLVLSWLNTPGKSGRTPSVNSQYHHRAAVRKMFETLRRLGITDANPAMQVALPRPPARRATGCTDDQINLLKSVAQFRINDTRTPAMLALALSGAAVTEQGFVTVDDVDLPGARVWVHNGGYRAVDRWIPLDDLWCLMAIERRVRHLREHGSDLGVQPLIYTAKGTVLDSDATIASRKQAASTGLTKLLKKAGIHQPGSLRVDSIREWVAHKIWNETASIEAVAVRLGYQSLDAAASLIGYDWRAADPTNDDAPAHRIQGESS